MKEGNGEGKEGCHIKLPRLLGSQGSSSSSFGRFFLFFLWFVFVMFSSFPFSL